MRQSLRGLQRTQPMHKLLWVILQQQRNLRALPYQLRDLHRPFPLPHLHLQLLRCLQRRLHNLQHSNNRLPDLLVLDLLSNLQRRLRPPLRHLPHQILRPVRRLHSPNRSSVPPPLRRDRLRDLLLLEEASRLHGSLIQQSIKRPSCDLLPNPVMMVWIYCR